MKIRIVLTADDGTILTNGTDYGRVIWLADGAKAEDYHAISEAEYEAIMAAQSEEVPE